MEDFMASAMDWDVFISHASEDKEAIALPLSGLLRRRGLRVWLDQQELVIGDSLRRRIDEGLARSRWGVVILSPHFIEKEWPQAELDALVTRELQGERVLLPVWHGITAAELSRKSPLLASRIAVDTQRGLDTVCDAILRAIGKGELPPDGAQSAGSSSLAALWDSLEPDPHAAETGPAAYFMLDRAFADRHAFSREVIGDYVLGEYLGRGGAGAVFRATHRTVGRTVALKLFYPVDASLEYLIDATHRAVRGLGTLRHPNIAVVHDFGTVKLSARTVVYLALDLVRGSASNEWSEKLPRDETATTRRMDMSIRIAEALEAAHACRFVGPLGFTETGVLHGDIKPSNVLVRHERDDPVVLDFMIPDLQRLLPMERGSGQWGKVNGRYHYTAPITLAFGTPGYMPPEQEIDGIVTPTSDVYSLGRTLHELILEPLLTHDQSTGTDETRRQLFEFIPQMYAAEPDERPQSMREVVAQLQRIRASLDAP